MLKHLYLAIAIASVALLRYGPASAQQRDLERISIVARDGRVFRIANYQRRWLLINYWGTWCNACLKVFPSLNTLSANPKLQVIGLSDETIFNKK